MAKEDPKAAVEKYLMTYRAAPHNTTGKSPYELIFRRKMKTKLPSMKIRQDNKVEKEAREKHDERKRRQKEQHDKKHKAKEKEIRPGDKVMIRRKKTTLDTPWDPKEFQVTEIKGAKLILNRQGEVKHRAKNNVKQLKGREIQNERITKKQPIERKTRREIDVEVSWDKIRGQTESREKDEDQQVTNPSTHEVDEEGDRQDKSSESGNSTDSQFTVVWESEEYEKEEDRQEEEQERVRELAPTSEEDDSKPIATRTRSAALSPRERKRKRAQAAKRSTGR